MGRFDETYRRSLKQPEDFWAEAAAAIDWDEPWDRVLDDSHPPFYRWFTGGRLNTCHNALDRHVEGGRSNQVALVHDSPVTDSTTTFTYRELRDAVARFAGVLTAQGVARGDRVIVYMPMVPEAVIAMLACARIGAIHSVVFGGFAADELASRIDDAQPKVIVSAPRLRARRRSPRTASSCSDRCSRPSSSRRAISTGATWSPTPSPCRACPLTQPIRSTSSTRPGRRANRKESFATTADTRSRSHGR